MSLRLWLSPAHEQHDRVVLDVEARRRLHEDVGELAVMGWKDERAGDAVAVEEPARQQQRGALVSLSEPLRSGHTACQDRCRLDGILHALDGGKGTYDALEVVGFVEPLVVLSYGAVEGDGEFEGGTPQWSCR